MSRRHLFAVLLAVVLAASCARSAPPAADPDGPATPGATPDPSPPVTAAPPAAWRLEPIGALTPARAAHQATLLDDGRVLVTGGCGGNHCDTFFAAAELFDPATGGVTPLPPLAAPRAGHVATRLADGRVLITGGWTGSGVTARTELFDPQRGTWAAGPDMTTARASHGAVLLDDGRVLVAGGGTGALGDLVSAEFYDPEHNRFTPLPSMAGNHYLATKLADGRVLLTGGQAADGAVWGSAELFDPATDTFQPTGSLLTPRVKHGAARLPDGRVLIVAGSDDTRSNTLFATTELYDPATGTFTPGPSLAAARHKIRDAVVALPDGSVLVAGGADQPERFDPADNRFTPVAGTLGAPVMFATATVLPSGDVLILGGYDERTQVQDGAWLLRSGAAAVACPVSEPQWAVPPADAAVPGSPAPGLFFINADESIWASAWWAEDGAAAGSVGGDGVKVGWFRPQGAPLVITGQRLDGPAPPLDAHVPCCYPTRFQATGLIFPTPGCWQITARAADSTLTFTVDVAR